MLFVIISHYKLIYFYLAPEGVARYCFHPVCLSVCECVCVCVCVSGKYFGILFLTIIRDIDLKCIYDTYGVVLNLLNTINIAF